MVVPIGQHEAMTSEIRVRPATVGDATCTDFCPASTIEPSAGSALNTQVADAGSRTQRK